MTTSARVAMILDLLQDIAAGELDRRIPISPAHDELDAVAHAVNVVAGELDYATRRLARARDDAEEANAAKTVFLRNISHELRTPLSAILIIAEMLQRENLSHERRKELHARIIANVRAQVELLDDLLDLSQVESGKVDLDVQPLAVCPLLSEVVRSLEPPALEKGLTLSLEPCDDLHVLGDPRRVRQILVNVVGNAIKFTERGRVAARAAREGSHVVMDVADTGIGVEPEKASRLFEPFMQADRSIVRRFGGSGLGLALSRRLAREMGGELAIVATAPGVGTVVRLTLPSHRAAVDGGEIAKVGEVPTWPGLRDTCILLVEDHEDIRMAMSTLLVSQGAVVMEARGGGEAIELGARDGIDVILMDVRMPGIDGLEATRRLRSRGVRVPIVAVTADVVAERRQAYEDAGFTTQLAKPVDIGHLIQTIHRLRGTAPEAA